MGKAIEELAHFAAGTPWEQIPGPVRQHAKLVMLDTLGVILAGSVQPEVAGARAQLTATGGRGATVYAPGWPTTDPRTAALLNGLAGRSIELCEGHRYVSCQGAVQVLPTALASGEWLERSGRETLAALQVNTVYRLVSSNDEIGSDFRPVAGSGLAAGASTETLRLKASRGYTGTDPIEDLLTNSKFVDAKVEVFVKAGPGQWTRIGEYPIAREFTGS
jgi:2-methylcitrate dehydratase PrpD